MIEWVTRESYISQTSFVTYVFYCTFQVTIMWETIEKVLNKILRQLLLLRNHLKFKITQLAKINVNVSLITKVSGKQLSFHIQELQKLVNASEKNSKWSGKSISTWDKKCKSTSMAKFVTVIFFSFHNAFAHRKTEKRDVSAVMPTCLYWGLLRVFQGIGSTAQSCSPSLSKRSGKRTKPLYCGGISVSRPIVRHERHGSP